MSEPRGLTVYDAAAAARASLGGFNNWLLSPGDPHALRWILIVIYSNVFLFMLDQRKLVYCCNGMNGRGGVLQTSSTVSVDYITVD